MVTGWIDVFDALVSGRLRTLTELPELVPIHLALKTRFQRTNECFALFSDHCLGFPDLPIQRLTLLEY
jgi:hypothetical protein